MSFKRHLKRALPRAFFHSGAAEVAPRLVGHLLFRRTENSLAGGIIVEVEAYETGDEASHAFNRRTERVRSMWGPPGHAYVYQTRHLFCINAVCRPEGTAEGVLIRAIEPVLGIDAMKSRRGDVQSHHLASGPGRLCSALAIDRSLDGVDLTDASGPLFIGGAENAESNRDRLAPLVVSTRIGISKAIDRPLRFYLEGSRHVSKRRRALR